MGASNAKASCSGISYGTWSVVPQTDVGNGVIPEFYKFDNPYAVVNSTTNALTYLDVEIVGAAGFGSNIVYYSTVAKFTPANGFLDNVWWSNYESYNANSVQSRHRQHLVRLLPLPGHRLQQFGELHPGVLRHHRLGHRPGVHQ